MSANLCFTTDSFFFLLSLLPPNLRARLTEPNQNRPHARSITAIWKRTSNTWGIPSPYKSGPKNHFLATSQLNGKFNDICLRKEARYRRSVKCVDNYEWSPTSSVMDLGQNFSQRLNLLFCRLWSNLRVYSTTSCHSSHSHHYHHASLLIHCHHNFSQQLFLTLLLFISGSKQTQHYDRRFVVFYHIFPIHFVHLVLYSLTLTSFRLAFVITPILIIITITHWVFHSRHKTYFLFQKYTFQRRV